MITTAIMEFVRKSAKLMRFAMVLFNHARQGATFCIQNVSRQQIRENTVTQKLRIHADLWLFVKANVFPFLPSLWIKVSSSMLLHPSIRIRAIFVIAGMLLLQMMGSIDANQGLNLILILLSLITHLSLLCVLIKPILFQMLQTSPNQANSRLLRCVDSTKTTICIVLDKLEISNLNLFFLQLRILLH